MTSFWSTIKHSKEKERKIRSSFLSFFMIAQRKASDTDNKENGRKWRFDGISHEPKIDRRRPSLFFFTRPNERSEFTTAHPHRMSLSLSPSLSFALHNHVRALKFQRDRLICITMERDSSRSADFSIHQRWIIISRPKKKKKNQRIIIIKKNQDNGNPDQQQRYGTRVVIIAIPTRWLLWSRKPFHHARLDISRQGTNKTTKNRHLHIIVMITTPTTPAGTKRKKII